MNREIAIEIKSEGMRREDFSRMVRFFDGGAVLLAWCFPLVRHGLKVFWRRRTRRSEMMEVCTSGLAEHRRAILLAEEMRQE
jgi:hypothetical protein